MRFLHLHSYLKWSSNRDDVCWSVWSRSHGNVARWAVDSCVKTKGGTKKSWLIDNNKKVLIDKAGSLCWIIIVIIVFHGLLGLLSFSIIYHGLHIESKPTPKRSCVFLCASMGNNCCLARRFCTVGNCVGLDCFRFCTGLAWLSQHVLGSCLCSNTWVVVLVQPSWGLKATLNKPRGPTQNMWKAKQLEIWFDAVLVLISRVVLDMVLLYYLGWSIVKHDFL